MHPGLRPLPLILLFCLAACGRDDIGYARPDMDASNTRAQPQCPGCQALHCQRYPLEALHAHSQAHELEIFTLYLACLEDSGIHDPCLPYLPTSAMFSDRFYPADWADYEACQRLHGPPQPSPQHRCQYLLHAAEHTTQPSARQWYLAHYEACIHSLR